MKRFLLAVLMLGTLLSAVAEPHKTPTDAHLFGHVVDKHTKSHVAYATIVLLGTTIGTTTDATGHFLMKNLPLGD